LQANEGIKSIQFFKSTQTSDSVGFPVSKANKNKVNYSFELIIKKLVFMYQRKINKKDTKNVFEVAESIYVNYL